MTSSQPIVLINGQVVPVGQAQVSIFDFGFTMGVSVTEQVRTYRRQAPLLDRHLDRLRSGLETIGLPAPFSQEDLAAQVQQIVFANGQHLDAEDEIGVGICVTPGLATNDYRPMRGPTTVIYTYRLSTSALSQTQAGGVKIRSVPTQEIPAACIPKQLKCRSRMHYYLAEQQAVAREPGSRALLTDSRGFVTEATTASVIMVRDETVLAPRPEAVLPSVSLQYAIEVLERLEKKVERRDLTVEEFERADEVVWLSTPVLIAPVTHVNGHQIGSGLAGQLTQSLSQAMFDSLAR